MAYERRLTRQNPGCVLILIDQSGSMEADWHRSGKKKKVACAEIVNAAVDRLIFANESGEQVHDRCMVGVIGYNGSLARSCFHGPLSGRQLVGVAELDETLGRLGKSELQSWQWVTPEASGGTPMTLAFDLAFDWLSEWIANHRQSFPPIVFNLTDGEPHDLSSAAAAARRLHDLSTDDGGLLMFNVHISDGTSPPDILPHVLPEGAPAEQRFLFDISSRLPDRMRRLAAGLFHREEGGRQVPVRVAAGSRAFAYNVAVADQLVNLLDFGTMAIPASSIPHYGKGDELGS